MKGTPAVTSWGGDRQDIFFKGLDTNLYRKIFTGGVWSPSPQGFENLGGPVAGSPAAASIASNRITLISNGSEHDYWAYKGWFDGSQWAPTDDTWYNLGGIPNGAPTLFAIPGTAVNLIAVDRIFTPHISNYKPDGPPNTYGWSPMASMGGTISW